MHNPHPPGISYFPFHGLNLQYLEIIDRVLLKINCSHLKTRFFIIFDLIICNLLQPSRKFLSWAPPLPLGNFYPLAPAPPRNFHWPSVLVGGGGYGYFLESHNLLLCTQIFSPTDFNPAAHISHCPPSIDINKIIFISSHNKWSHRKVPMIKRCFFKKNCTLHFIALPLFKVSFSQEFYLRT